MLTFCHHRRFGLTWISRIRGNDAHSARTFATLTRFRFHRKRIRSSARRNHSQHPPTLCNLKRKDLLKPVPFPAIFAPRPRPGFVRQGPLAERYGKPRRPKARWRPISSPGANERSPGKSRGLVPSRPRRWRSCCFARICRKSLPARFPECLALRRRSSNAAPAVALRASRFQSRPSPRFAEAKI